MKFLKFLSQKDQTDTYDALRRSSYTTVNKDLEEITTAHAYLSIVEKYEINYSPFTTKKLVDNERASFQRKIDKAFKKSVIGGQAIECLSSHGWTLTEWLDYRFNEIYAQKRSDFLSFFLRVALTSISLTGLAVGFIWLAFHIWAVSLLATVPVFGMVKVIFDRL